MAAKFKANRQAEELIGWIRTGHTAFVLPYEERN